MMRTLIAALMMLTFGAALAAQEAPLNLNTGEASFLKLKSLVTVTVPRTDRAAAQGQEGGRSARVAGPRAPPHIR
jgi:hypothetical protein